MGTALDTYRAKRDFARTPEPRGTRARRGTQTLRFVVQRHEARHLHYDLRLELDGTLKSWALPKQPPVSVPSSARSGKRLAVQVEDHPLSYADFEGEIPPGQYGAGTVTVWDEGVWVPDGDARRGYRDGKLAFTLHGRRLQGAWTLVRMRDTRARQPQWLLFRRADATEAAAPSVLPTRAASLPGAVRAALPERMAPMLATLVDTPPSGSGWHAEAKLDGYRLLVRVHRGEPRFFTRAGHDWTARFARQADELARRGLRDGWFDGEAVMPGATGLPDFQALQNAFEHGHADRAMVFLFDMMHYDGYDLRACSLSDRQALLRHVLADAHGAVRVLDALPGAPDALFHQACDASLEGLMFKRDGAPYVNRRTDAWLKVKCRRRQEFVIVGFTEPAGTRLGLGALLLGYYDDGQLRYAGKVGTGFDARALAHLRRRLDALAASATPLAAPDAGVRWPRGTHWVRPRLVCEVAFSEWTRGGHVRQGAFIALRTDKPAGQVGRERPAPASRVSSFSILPAMSSKSSKPRSSRTAAVAVTHAERVIDAHSGVTKGELADYYHGVAAWVLPHLKRRPVAVLRAPDGIGGEMFFQKHAARLIPGTRELDAALDPGHDPLMEIDSIHALDSAVQMGTVELHTWNARSDRIEQPDRMIFDLDPGARVAFSRVIDAARLTRALLDELGLTAFVKTSGGKGLHVVVPIARRHTWDDVKAFCHAVSTYLAHVFPDHFTATPGSRHRVGKIFVDYLRNYRGATTVSAYAVRAREGMPVSVPIAWDELDELTGGGHWTVRTLPQRLAGLQHDPWQSYARAARQRITQAMRQQIGRV